MSGQLPVLDSAHGGGAECQGGTIRQHSTVCSHSIAFMTGTVWLCGR